VWEAFYEKMIKTYPNLEPFITRRISIFSDHTDDPVIKEEGFSSKMDFLEGFRDLRIWQPRVVEVLRRCGLDENVPIKVISHGQNPVNMFMYNLILIDNIKLYLKHIIKY
jgi:hypothetical protein